VHAGHAAHVELAAVARRQQRQGGGQGAHGGAGVAQEQGGLIHRQLTTQPMHAKGAVGLAFELAPQLGQRFEHHLRVI